MKDLPDMWVIRSNPFVNKSVVGKQILACSKATIDNNNKVVEIGPIAVKPDYQVGKIS